MTTVTLWLLVSLGWNTLGAPPTTVVERFATAQECSRVMDVLNSSIDGKRHPMLLCVQAAVVKP
jgi:hypothetical protein